MPILDNPKWERFAQELAQGKTQPDAYEAAGYVRNESNASYLRGKQQVSARVRELQGESAAIACLTKAWVLERLMINTERALQEREVLDRDGKPTGEFMYDGHVANRSLELLGKEQGMFIDRKEVGAPGEFDRMSAEELREFIVRKSEALGLLQRPMKQLQLVDGSECSD